MDCIKRWSVVSLVIFGLAQLAGCNKKSDTPANNANAAVEEAPQIKETDPNSSPVARVAADWLGAVLKGETEQAKSLLTPQAIQRIAASGTGFAPPGLAKATFKLGEIRSPSADQALVQCVLTDTSEAQPHSEEMCCLLRKVENDWRVCGIAYGTGPNMPWTLTNFETGQNMGIPRQVMGGMASQNNPGQQPNPGMQQMTPPVNPPAPLGPPTTGQPVAGPANVNSPASTTGLGMPAVGPVSPAPPQQVQPIYQSPYTAQGPQGSEQR
jgi:hypothetical protein